MVHELACYLCTGDMLVYSVGFQLFGVHAAEASITDISNRCALPEHIFHEGFGRFMAKDKSAVKGKNLRLIRYFLEQSPLFAALLFPVVNP